MHSMRRVGSNNISWDFEESVIPEAMCMVVGAVQLGAMNDGPDLFQHNQCSYLGL